MRCRNTFTIASLFSLPLESLLESMLKRITSDGVFAASIRPDEAQKALQDLIRLRVLDRRYIVLVQGYVAHDSGTIESTSTARHSSIRSDAKAG